MTSGNDQRRCLIVERHDWETGGNQQQLQIPIDVAEEFFGTGAASRQILVRMFSNPNSSNPIIQKNVTISHTYNNGTRRVNGFAEIGLMPSCFLFFEETGTYGVYDVWHVVDKAIVAARFRNWQQGRNTQHDRGRLATIVAGPVTRIFNRIQLGS